MFRVFSSLGLLLGFQGFLFVFFQFGVSIYLEISSAFFSNTKRFDMIFLFYDPNIFGFVCVLIRF